MKKLACTLSWLAVAILPISVQATDFPQRTVSWVVPYSAGGGTDVVARAVANQMSGLLGQSIVVENKPGANTAIGASHVARAAADGYTVASADNATLALNQHLFSKLTYKPATDFSFIGGLARFPYVLVVHPDVPARTVAELLELARQKPGTISYGSPGMGGPNHVAMEQLQQRTQVKFLHVAYRGAAPVMQDLVAGQIQFSLIDTASSMPYIQSKRVRPIAVSTENRLSSLPDIPTFGEAGVEDFIAFSWQGLIAPKGTPPGIVARLNKELNKALENPRVQETLSAMGVQATPTTPSEFKDFVKQQDAMWGEVITRASISLE